MTIGILLLLIFCQLSFAATNKQKRTGGSGGGGDIGPGAPELLWRTPVANECPVSGNLETVLNIGCFVNYTSHVYSHTISASPPFDLYTISCSQTGNMALYPGGSGCTGTPVLVAPVLCYVGEEFGSPSSDILECCGR